MPSSGPSEITGAPKKWVKFAILSFLVIGLMTSLKYLGKIKENFYLQAATKRKSSSPPYESNLVWNNLLIMQNFTKDTTTTPESPITLARQTHLSTTDSFLTRLKPKITTDEYDDHRIDHTDRSSTLRIIPPDMVNIMAPEISKFIGKERSSKYKNPCWPNTIGSLFCVPYFFLLGVTKCGTSDIYGKLAMHPQIVSAINKESHWWTQTRLIIGDGSPSTFWDNHNWRTIFPNHTEGPPYVVADLIHAVDPEAKLIVTFRDPVERMYSSYNFFTSQHSPEVFHENVLERLSIFHECLKVNSLRACAYQDILDFSPVVRDKPVMQLRMGIYHVFLEDWYQVYPKDQLFILELRDWQQNCPSLLPQIYQFLELDPVPGSMINSICHRPMKNRAKHVIKPMLPATRSLLEEFYKPYNKKLYEILQDPRFNWDYS